MKITKTLLLCALVGAFPASVLVSGCGGGGTNIFGNLSIAGSYTGTYRVTSGPSTGLTGPISLTISSNGTIAGTATDNSDGTSTAPFTGTANTSNGNFSVSGLFGETGVNGNASGNITVNGTLISGTGTFALSNNNKGTLTFSNAS